MKSHFAMLAGYNRWANGRIYTAVRALSDADYRAERGAFFGSLHGTLNHLLVADRIWMRRFTGTGPVQTRLDEILFEDLPAGFLLFGHRSFVLYGSVQFGQNGQCDGAP